MSGQPCGARRLNYSQLPSFLRTIDSSTVPAATCTTRVVYDIKLSLKNPAVSAALLTREKRAETWSLLFLHVLA